MARKVAVLALAAVIGSAAAGSVSLTDDNFDAQVFDSGMHPCSSYFGLFYLCVGVAQSTVPLGAPSLLCLLLTRTLDQSCLVM